MKESKQSTASILPQQSKFTKERQNAIILNEYESSLLNQQDIFQQYAENCDDVIYQFSLDLTKILYLNPAAETIWDISCTNLQQNPQLWFESMHPEDRAIVRDAILDMVKENKQNLWLEYRIKKADGTILYLNDNIVLIKDAKGDAYCVMGTIANISKSVQIKKYTAISEQILSVIENERGIELISEIILKITCGAFNWAEGEVWVLDNASKSLYCLKMWHKLSEGAKEFYEMKNKLILKEGTGFPGEVIRNNFPTLVTDFPKHKEYFRGKVAAKAHLQSAFGLPIVYQGKIIGVMIFFSKEIKSIDQDEVKIMQRITEIYGHALQQQLNDEKFNYLILHDDLTGLLNRNGLERLLTQCIKDVDSNMLAVIFIDLDRFKLINETMGFDIGDLLLKTIAIKLRDQLSDSFKVMANIGADRFVLVADKIKNVKQIQALIDRTLAVFIRPFNIKDKEIYSTVSIGISVYPYDGDNMTTLLKNADIALYQAKASGGSAVQFCTTTLQKTVLNALDIENGLRHALNENQLKLYYQPKVDIKTGDIVGVEALIRWQDPKIGFRLPNSFISIAEESDLIIQIGEWVFHEICYHFPLCELHLPVSVNISARQFKKRYDLVGFISNLINKLSIPPILLDIEVTESALIEDAERSSEVLNVLKKIGITVTIDDFGTGYSSFEYLKKFQPDRIKIDKSFIDLIPYDIHSVAIVRAMIALSKALEIKIIAEGVEREDQLKILIEEGCDEIQGFYFAKPMPLYELNELILNATKLKFPAKGITPEAK